MLRLSENVEVNVNKVFGRFELAVEVTGVCELRIRIAIGKLLMKAAAYVMGCGIKVDVFRWQR